MAAHRALERFGQLWQLPLLFISLGLFGYAAYVFIDPKPGPTIDQKIDVARAYLTQERPDSALEQLNRILAIDKMDSSKQGVVHLMIGQALDMGQQHLKISIPENYRRIIEQTQMALADGAIADAAVHRRLAESLAALNQTPSAIQHYRLAIAMDADHSLHLRRKMIDLQLASDDPSAAMVSLDEYLEQPELTAAERSWALAQKAGQLIDQHRYPEAKKMLADALKLNSDPVQQGQFNFQLGYCAWKENNPKDSERFLRFARDQIKPNHPLDGDACFILGKIYQDRGDAQSANSFYEVVMVNHPDSKYEPLAHLGRGICRIMLGQTAPGLSDLHDLTAELSRKQSRAILKGDAIDGFRVAATQLSQQENYQGALEVLSYEQQLEPLPQANFFGRLGDLYERRSDQIELSLADAPAAEQIRRSQQVRDDRTHAGDAFVAYSRALTLADDKAYGTAMWHGIDLYDKAGNMQSVITALELFAAERPEDKLAPDALLRLGRSYQAAGSFDKAIEAFQRDQFRYPRSLAASKCAVPLAQAYMAKGPELYPKAERTLLSVIQNNELIDPSAQEFRESLFELSQLYYRTQRYEEAISKLEEMTQRYPDDTRAAQLTFLKADSYRKSASLLDVRLASAGPTSSDVAEAVAAKRQRLAQARGLFDKVVEMYQAAPPDTDTPRLYQKLSHFYRADCMYDLGQYDQAIKLYDAAAFRYQDDPSALAAYVQIVNSYCALGKLQEAKTANERAKWILRRMPPDAFKDGSFSMPKKYWDDWLKWTSESGVF